MKKLAAFTLVVLAACSSSSSAPKPTWTGGKDFTPAKSTPLASVDAAAVDSEIEIEGTVARVCQKRGCWVEISDGTTVVMAKSLSHGVLLPLDCAGKKARIRGLVRNSPPKEEEPGETKEHDCPNPKRLVEIVGAQLY